MNCSLLLIPFLLLKPVVVCPGDTYDRIAIAALGHVPEEREIGDFCKTAKLLPADETQTEYIRFLMHREAFIENMTASLRFSLLQGTNESEIVQYLIDFDQVKLQPGNRAFGTHEFDRLERLYFADRDYLTGKIRLSEVLVRHFDNYIYDQLNMGIDNFVTTAFQYMLGRYPTNYEKSQAKRMCDGDRGTLFFREGNNRQDFLHLLVFSDNFLEYQSAVWYEKLLMKTPEPEVVARIMRSAWAADTAGDPLEAIIFQILNDYTS